MNDFKHGKFEGARLNANDVDALHSRCLEWLQKALAASSATRKVVVTHHCPTFRPDFNGYPGGALNSAFQVDYVFSNEHSAFNRHAFIDL